MEIEEIDTLYSPRSLFQWSVASAVQAGLPAPSEEITDKQRGGGTERKTTKHRVEESTEANTRKKTTHGMGGAHVLDALYLL